MDDTNIIYKCSNYKKSDLKNLEYLFKSLKRQVLVVSLFLSRWRMLLSVPLAPLRILSVSFSLDFIQNNHHTGRKIH